MKVIEKFIGVEGEGLWTGLPVATIRLAGCNLRCENCDTSYSWASGTEVSMEELLTFVSDSKIKNVSITGGEPLYRQTEDEFNELTQFIFLLSSEYFVKVETNGTIVPCRSLQESVFLWSVSPKIGGLGDTYDVEVLRKFASEVWDYQRQNVQFKFVIDVDNNGLKNVKEILKGSKLDELITNSYIPAVFHPVAELNDSLEEYRRKYALLIDSVLADTYWRKYNFRVMLQSHKIAFGDMKGR